MTKLENIKGIYDVEFLSADGFDEAVIGVEPNNLVLIYSIKKCVDILVERDGMDRDEAREFLDHNSICAHMGEDTPIWCDDEYL
jgi:hypothetical protein